MNSKETRSIKYTFSGYQIPPAESEDWFLASPHAGFKELQWTAFHEAAHAIAGNAAGLQPVSLRIMTDGSGRTEYTRAPISSELAAVAYLCGMAAEYKAGNEWPWPHGYNDALAARRLVRARIGASASDIQAAMQATWRAAAIFVSSPEAWGAIHEVAAFLLNDRQLEGKKLQQILSPGGPRLLFLPIPEWELPLFAAASAMREQQSMPGALEKSLGLARNRRANSAGLADGSKRVGKPNDP